MAKQTVPPLPLPKGLALKGPFRGLSSGSADGGNDPNFRLHFRWTTTPSSVLTATIVQDGFDGMVEILTSFT
jgi:hypothetical protein